ncbi:MAG: SAM-dependent chlorinase/fluorinase, partial [Chloroflexota bacterium]
PILVFQTDFTYKEGAVSSMYGVVKSVDRELEIFDGTHEIPKYDIWSASYRLYQSMTFWPAGTIFVSVVDPGVGTPRRACAAKTTEGYYVISPDNGSLTHTKAWQGIVEVREIDPAVNRLKGKNTEGTSVFHGRDLFGYCAARLASGIISYEQVGPAYDINDIVTLPIMEPVLKDGMVQGIFEISDPNFGNLWTNIPLSMFDQAGFVYGDHLKLVIKHQEQVVFNDRVLFHKSFGFAKKGEAIIYNNELMKVSLAVSQGSFSEHYHMDFGPDWVVQFQK